MNRVRLGKNNSITDNLKFKIQFSETNIRDLLAQPKINQELIDWPREEIRKAMDQLKIPMKL